MFSDENVGWTKASAFHAGIVPTDASMVDTSPAKKRLLLCPPYNFLQSSIPINQRINSYFGIARLGTSSGGGTTAADAAAGVVGDAGANTCP
jgi:hypothetical protein